MNYYHSPVYIRLSEYLFDCRKKSVYVNIALVLLRKINQFPAINIEEIALLAHTTPASVTRFCKVLGYPRFLALKEDLSPFFSETLPTVVTPSDPWQQEIDMLQRIHQHIPLAACQQIATVLDHSRELLILGNDYGFTAANLLREALTDDHRKVYCLHRQSDTHLLSSFLRQCDTVLLIDLTGGWRQQHAALFASLHHCHRICFTACPATGFDYVIDFSTLPGFFRSNYFSSRALISTVFRISGLISPPANTNP